MENKRGQGLSTSAIILIILGIFILVILILGFTIGWEKLNPFLPSNNVNSLKDACSLACTQNSVVDFCTINREFNMKKDTPTGLVSGKEYTCVQLADFESELGIESCSNLCISCKSVGGEIKLNTDCAKPVTNTLVKGFGVDEICCEKEDTTCVGLGGVPKLIAECEANKIIQATDITDTTQVCCKL